MRKVPVISFLPLILVLTLFSCSNGRKDALVVWTYDSFVSEWGPAAKIAELFTARTGIPVEFVSKGDGGALLAAVLEKETATGVDVVIGLDNILAPRALEAGVFSPVKFPGQAALDPALVVDPDMRLIPYDYGHFAIIWDSESGIPAPNSLSDLLDPAYGKQLIIMDPRTSTPGLGFLAWTQAVFGDGWESYWEKLKPSVLAMTPGWDTGYGLFTKGEAALALSYSTSPAYHKAYENSERYKTLAFPEGHPAQIELAGMTAWTKHSRDAKRFLEFLLSREAQALLPETQWMYPAIKLDRMPDSFSVVPDLKLIPAGVGDLRQDPEKAAAALSRGAD